MSDKRPRLVLGVTGSIAAYKAGDIIRGLMDDGWDVTVVMTRTATEFIGEITLRTLSRNPVYVDMFESREAWRPEHIDLAESATAILIAPCTANMLAKIAHGLADDVVSCTVLAAQSPVVIAPAMNEFMWLNPATQANVDSLRARGTHVLDMKTGELACGTEGLGKLADPEYIVDAMSAFKT